MYECEHVNAMGTTVEKRRTDTSRTVQSAREQKEEAQKMD